MLENTGKPNVNAHGVKVAVFDLDGTLTYKDTYIEFLKQCLKKRPWRYLLGGNLIFYFLLYKSGIRSNHWLKARFLKTLAVGMPVDKFVQLCEEFSCQSIDNNIKPKAMVEIDRLRQEGYILVLATASFDFYVSHLFESLNMDYLLCSKAAMNQRGCITGEIDGKNCIGLEKSQRVAALLKEHGLGAVDRAYSDDRVDLPLFEMAGTPLVVDPGKSTAALALQRDWQVLDWR